MSKKQTTAEEPLPVREVNQLVKGWIERLGHVWVEGQLTQINVKPTWKLSYLTLRDVEAQSSVQLTCPTELVSGAHLNDGDRVVVYAKPAFYQGRGSFSLWTTSIRHVGVGDLLARIEKLRRQLAAEGLTDPARKRPLPFLPKTIGLITGRDSAAERDVLAVSQDRWPAVSFRVINTPVQGSGTAPKVIEALRILDADPDVNVIIIARGGGSVEDLLPFSDEALQRAVAAAATPVVSAIGHEPDHPVLDDVADLRAATPTDAAKRVVPDVAEELQLLTDLRARAAQALRGWVLREHRSLESLRSRPALAAPTGALERRRDDTRRAVADLRRSMQHLLSREISQVGGLRARVVALGPAATLARGYAIVQVTTREHREPVVATSIGQTPPGSQLRIRLTDGSITAATMAASPAD